MAQDKSAEIINFSGAADPLQPAAPEAPEGAASENAPILDEAASSALEEIGAGAFLREARATAKLSIEEVSDATKVKAAHLEAIEWMRFDRLPALPYAIGFVKTYASHLGLDGEAVAAKFKAEAGADKAAAMAQASASSAPAATPASDSARLGSVFAMLVVALFALWVGYQVLTGGNNSSDLVAPPSVTQASTVQTSAPLAVTHVNETPQASDEAAIEETAERATPTEGIVGETQIPAGASIDNGVVADADPVALGDTLTNEVAIITPPAVTEPPRARPLPRRARPATPRVRQSVIIEARLTRSIAPAYPNRCTRGAADMESVTIRFDVSAEGRPVNARVLSSTNGCFETEALRTVRRWRFNPRSVDGAQALESGKTATVNFRK